MTAATETWLSNCLELPVGELDTGFTHNGMCKWKGTLWKDRRVAF